MTRRFVLALIATALLAAPHHRREIVAQPNPAPARASCDGHDGS